MSVDNKEGFISQKTFSQKKRSYLKIILIAILLCNISLSLYLTYQVVQSRSVLRSNKNMNRVLVEQVQRLRDRVDDFQNTMISAHLSRNTFEQDIYDRSLNQDKRIEKISNNLEYLWESASDSDPNFLQLISQCSKVDQFKSLVSTFVLSNLNVITPKVRNKLNLFIQELDSLNCGQ